MGMPISLLIVVKSRVCERTLKRTVGHRQSYSYTGVRMMADLSSLARTRAERWVLRVVSKTQDLSTVGLIGVSLIGVVVSLADVILNGDVEALAFTGLFLLLGVSSFERRVFWTLLQRQAKEIEALREASIPSQGSFDEEAAE